GRELTPHKGSASNLKYLTRVRNVNVESEQSEDSLTKRSYPDLKHLTRLEMSSPDLSEVRVGTHKKSCPD
ncbi:MAG: hypothetical protein ACLPVJ_00365, partial [Syntrophobacteraceae bacterium]